MDVTRETSLDTSLDEVWELISTADALSEWFGAEADGEVVPGAVVVFRWPDGTERRALIERVERGVALLFRWLPGRGGFLPSRVEIVLEETEEGCAVRVTETRFEASVSPGPEIGFRPLASMRR